MCGRIRNIFLCIHVTECFDNNFVAYLFKSFTRNINIDTVICYGQNKTGGWFKIQSFTAAFIVDDMSLNPIHFLIVHQDKFPGSTFYMLALHGNINESMGCCGI